MIFEIKLLGKIVYLCKVLLLEKLFFWISEEHSRLLILRAFILECCIKTFGGCLKEFSV